MACLGASVVGLGVGEQHARAFAKDPRTKLHGLFDVDSRRSEMLARELSVPIVFQSYEDLLDSSDTQIVSIASFDDEHFGQILPALRSGKHLFIEKPLCRSYDELGKIKNAWQDAGEPALMSNLVLRGAPLWSWLRETIASGTFGKVFAIDGEYLYGRIQKITEGWRARVNDYSVLEGGGIHVIDLILTLTGEKPTSVRAVGNRISTRNSRFRYDDFVAATYEFPSGLIGRVVANFGCVHRHHHVIRVYGTEATFIYDDAGARLHLSRDEDVRATPVRHAPLPSGKGVLVPDFIDSVVNEEKRHEMARREFDLMTVCLAGEQARHNGEEIEITYDL